MPTSTRRRISYVIPPPTDPVPIFQLPPYAVPRHGENGPLLLSSQMASQHTSEERLTRHPRHRLGVVSLALDTSTQMVGRSAPEGILYSGARDGLVCSWDLEIAMKRRKVPESQPKAAGRWEAMTGWGDDMVDDEEGEDGEEKWMDGDVLGEVISPRRRRCGDGSIPYEYQWETDFDAYQPGKPTQFRQCSQTHSDWVNDLLLCNYNQTVISASSDGTIKAWSPHTPHQSDPVVIGTHTDYVRCLAHCREQKWIASGSFDRTIKLWDLNRTESPSVSEPLITLNPPDANAPKSSIYALAADPYGHTIASGSPERVVRIWDPRSGKRTAKLVGHTDNIRAIIISEDSKYLLTGSADASIKLWSLVSQRCLHTFTYHADSVWSLFSSHPSLHTFYSGDKTGLVCKVDVEDCADVSEGECIVICQDPGERSMASSEGVNKILVLDDNMLWTASGSSSIKRWKVPRRRAVRASLLNVSDRHESTVASRRRTPIHSTESAHGPPRLSTSPTSPASALSRPDSFLTPQSTTLDVRTREENSLYGIPFESLVRLASLNDPFTSFASVSRGRDPEVATLYSAASIMSVPHATSIRSPLHFQQPHISPSPLRGDVSSRLGLVDDAMHPRNTARAEFEERELAADAVPLYNNPDDIVHGDHGLVRSIVLNDRIHALTVDISGEVAVWDIVRGLCLGRYPRDDVTAASRCGSTRAGSDCSEKERSPREALEAVRERIEGEAVVAPWSLVDTKTGILSVHLNEKCFEAEIYADEAGFGPDQRFNDELRLNIGKWVLRNLFLGFIREETRIRRNHQTYEPKNLQASPILSELESNGNMSSHSFTNAANHVHPAQSFTGSSIVTTSTKMLPAMAPSPTNFTAPTTRYSPLFAPLIPLHITKEPLPMPSIPQSPLGSDDATPMPLHSHVQAADGSQPLSSPLTAVRDPDYFSVRARQSSASTDDFAAWGGSLKQDPSVPTTPITPGGGLMGRLKSLGKVGGKKGPGDVGLLSPVIEPNLASDAKNKGSAPPSPELPKTPQQIILSGPLAPPTSNEAPTLALPPNITLVISEEDYAGWRTVYRGTVASTMSDLRALEDTMPLWLLEYLLTNKVPAVPVQKISFVLLPWPDDEETLPELLNTAQSKLTASRFLRVRKLTYHVQDKLEKLDRRSSNSSSQGTPRLSLDAKMSHASPKADELYQILCNDIELPLNMTLAAVRQFVWRQSAELTMHYRRKPSNDNILVAQAL